MADISTEDIKALREKTGISIMQCKKALEEAGGDMEKAEIMLRKQSGAVAAKKSERTLGSGTVAAYVHTGGTVGAMVELLCETDFVARNEEFQQFAYELAMHVAAAAPQYLKMEDVSEEETVKVNEIFKEEAQDKPPELQEKIITGKREAYFKEKALLSQSYIKDPDKTIADLIQEATQKFGERVEVGEFTRLAI